MNFNQTMTPKQSIIFVIVIAIAIVTTVTIYTAWNIVYGYNLLYHANAQPVEFKTYKDDNFGFEIIYPSDWNVTTKNLKKSLVMFTSAEHKVAVVLGALNRVKDETLKEFGDRYFKNRDNIVISEYYRNPNTTLAGLPAVKMVGSIDMPATLFEGPHTNYVMYNNALLENRDLIFETLYASREYSAFNEFRPLAEKMISSIKVIDKPPIIQEQD
jgi:hypothetical protein